MSAGVFLKGLVKVPCFESTEDCANIVLKTNGLQVFTIQKKTHFTYPEYFRRHGKQCCFQL